MLIMEFSSSGSTPDQSRRGFLKQSLAVSATVAAIGALPRLSSAQPLTQRYPDPLVSVLDDSFTHIRIFNASVEKLASGMRWAEGPVWIGDGRYLLVSDIANNRIMRWDEVTGELSVYREHSNFSNGMCRDRQGRLLVCEGSSTTTEGRRVTRTEYNGRITVLADRFEGKPFNSPNDIACKRDGSIWFTDPTFQAESNYEGQRVKQEQPFGVYRIDPANGKVSRVIDDLAGPNGLCFSPDEKTLYVVEGRAKPHGLIWAIAVNEDGTLGERGKLIEGLDYAAIDGIKCDESGNLWCGWGGNGDPKADMEKLDGVRVFNPQGKAIGHISLPERCANVCFGGREGNRLFMASSHSLYSVFVNARGATFA
ncbi:SMP-30/gluconolactonase/LRE family protein [Pseudomonas syringae]|uniref:SMP-30/gluconolactonase/LRE family protein n=1 Tax=Pseudomonas syringae TaxID=317 RepID=UPI000CD05FFE|nr:twin-arginine translocation signal domain-containing protein [Pseudomonas syringae]POP98113.1 gluconolactonase [Pseudomonas syringae pv. syringae]MCF5202472.1 twin-arginine translocation signal domain-containing protein [Pseudomonas syringae]MCF5271113.1 twin-arginine translocation signal domain-containing protein [Pseudomonas syringae]MCF5275189.1 twin-arginine translocation signal domain-containing protein [Pseudomonas syringae]